MLTDAKIKGLKAPAGQRLEFPDELVPGLRLRVTASSKTWILRQRLGGKVRTVTLGPFGDGKAALSLSKARTAAHDVQGRAEEGALPVASVRASGADGKRVSDAIDLFMRRHAQEKVKRPESYRWMFDKYVVPHFGDWQTAAVTRRDLADFLDVIADKHGMTTARRVGGLCKRLWRFALSRDLIVTDPAAGVILPGAEVQRDRALEDREIRALWTATDPANKVEGLNKAGRPRPHPSDYPWGPYFRLLLLTGQRRGEVAAMRWDAVDLDAGTWALSAAETKSDRAHLVPLPKMAVDLLRTLPRHKIKASDGSEALSPWVLTTNGIAPVGGYSKPKGWLDAAMLEVLGKEKSDAELPDWRVHDLRRTVSTNLARLGVDPFVRRRVLNHALSGVDAIYDRFDYLDAKRVALSKWADALAAIVDDRPVGANVVELKAVN